MADRALAYLIIGNIWLAAAVLLEVLSHDVHALMAASAGFMLAWTSWSLTRRARRREESRRNLDRDAARCATVEPAIVGGDPRCCYPAGHEAYGLGHLFDGHATGDPLVDLMRSMAHADRREAHRG